jgi:serine-type D-Ala-D-Ala carboxypeptidase/endopeptidase (penicillin-binding protein 4)
MKKGIVLLLGMVATQVIHAQTVSQKLAAAVQQFTADSQMRHAIMSLCVVDAKTGEQVYAINEQVGLAPASTQKIFTSGAALELLGANYRYTTTINWNYLPEVNSNRGYFSIDASGDPTLGSDRYASTKPAVILDKVIAALKQKKINKVSGGIKIQDSLFEEVSIPGGWIFDDIGNYYGAGAGGFIWRENQYDIILRSGKKVDDPVSVRSVYPALYKVRFGNNSLKSAAKGSGDNAYVYFDPLLYLPILRGTIPINEDSFSISASLPDPGNLFGNELEERIKKNGIGANPLTNGHGSTSSAIKKIKQSEKTIKLVAHQSPALDSMNYWFMRRSINLYGEAFIKTLALQKTGFASTEEGAEAVKEFWSKNGIDKAAVNIIDGSGLSPQNRVTTDAEVKVLYYAQSRIWYTSFYNALPEYNGMKMKSGSIGGSRAYAGYHTAKDGKEYIFSIIVNNYDGSSGDVVKKMYKVLDVLK